MSGKEGRKEQEFEADGEKAGGRVGVYECVSLSGWAEKYVKAING